MLRLLSAVALTIVSCLALTAVIGPGLDSLQSGLESGKRMALAQYAAEHDSQ